MFSFFIPDLDRLPINYHGSHHTVSSKRRSVTTSTRIVTDDQMSDVSGSMLSVETGNKSRHDDVSGLLFIHLFGGRPIPVIRRTEYTAGGSTEEI